MKTRRQLAIFLCVFVASFGLTTLFRSQASTDEEKTVSAQPTKSSSRFTQTSFPAASVSETLASVTNLGTDFHKAKKQLSETHRSPLRLQAFLDYHLEELSYDELFEVLENSKALSHHDIQKIGRKITLEKPHEVFKTVYIDRAVSFGSIENYYSFAPVFASTWFDHHNPMDLLRHIESMTPGGTQQDISLTVSGQWRWRDPRKTADLFDRLTTLRSISATGTPQSARQHYADLIAESWLYKDKEEFIIYVNELPNGLAKTHLQSSLNKAEKK